MERKNIAFQYGIHRSPSAANDGELAECINLEVHNGELTPSVMPQVSFTLNKGEKLLFIHKTGSYKNYIIQKEVEEEGKIHKYLYWFSDTNKIQRTNIKEITPTSIHSVGNTLVVLSKNHMEYILFKSGYYKCIGSKPPFCSISFGLAAGKFVGFPAMHGSFTYEGAASDLTDWFVGFKDGIKDYFDNGTPPKHVSFVDDLPEIETENFSDATEYVKDMTEAFFPLLNKSVESNRKYGTFMHPFYLRYAYRMYDGSHYMQSAPVFFPLNMKGPVIYPTSYKDESYDFTCNFRISMLHANLDYAIIGFYNEDGEKVSNDIINDWKDIISGLDVFVSSPIYPYKQDGYATGYWGTDNLYGNSLRGTVKHFDYNDIMSTVYKNALYSDEFTKNTLAFTIEDNPEFGQQIKDVGLFYKISQFNIDKLVPLSSNLRTSLDIKEDTLTNLEQQEVLEDDYDSHNGIIPSFAHVYNGRLNISGIRTKLFSGFPMESMVPYTYDSSTENHFWYVSTKLEIEGREVTVVSESNVKLLEKPAFIYYPNAKAKKFTLNRYNGASGDPGYTNLAYYTATFNAEPHKLLNGSFYLSPTYGTGDTYTLTTSSSSPQPSGDPYLSYPNKIYTSEVNNPFFFPLAGRNSIGTGEIVAITSNTKAISPGQFGEYPLIVFSTDGVWAMQTGEEGLYYSVHPISKDICINPNVLQTDGPVLFVTDNGLHSLAGDSVQNISMHIKGKQESITIPSTDGDFAAIAEKAKDTDTFNQFIKDAVFAYDYANSRVLAYNEKHTFAYVIATDSGMITKLVLLSGDSPVVMSSAIQAYPEVYMQSGNDIYTFVPDKDDTGAVVNGVLVTRTMTFGDPLVMKVINDVRLLYHQSSKTSRCRYAMYVSNDGYNWAQRTSLRGHSFKYFRFVCFAELADTDALQGMSIMFDYRKSHKLR